MKVNFLNSHIPKNKNRLIQPVFTHFSPEPPPPPQSPIPSIVSLCKSSGKSRLNQHYGTSNKTKYIE